MAIDQVALEQRVAVVSWLMSAHAGKIEIENVSEEGVVRVRFLGLCSDCALKPHTLIQIVRPALSEIDGVTDVEGVGVRISEEAERRLMKRLAPSPWTALVSARKTMHEG